MPGGYQKIYVWLEPKSFNYLLRAIPTLCLILRRRRGEFFLDDSNTRAFCAEGAENIFYVIAAQEPFAPKARRDFVSKTQSRNNARKVSVLYKICDKIFNFSALGKIFENGG